jgi:hypothetical protein
MHKNSLPKKIMTSLVAGLACIALLLELGNSGTIPWLPPVLVFSLVGVLFAASLILPFIWHHREKRNRPSQFNTQGLLVSIVRYTTAFNLVIFGWKKIFRLQFNVPDAIAAKAMNQQSGEWLTWFYFGYSRKFVLLLAIIQIIGAWFLLFRRTALLAAICLFAFMLNLLLINIFYGMNAGALTQSILVTMSISFLILLEYDRLLVFFLQTRSALPAYEMKNNLWKNSLRLCVMLFSLLYVLYTTTL